MSSLLRRISQEGLSIWLDDLSRERFNASSPGSLARLIEEREVVGVTTNPAIFSAAISGSELYNEDLIRLAKRGLSPGEVIRSLTIADVQRAAEIFLDIFKRSGGRDGRVSIEVDPELARNTIATIEEGVALWRDVDRPNLLVKVPATREGLPAITELTRRGISVNVTLIFTASRYDEVIDAFMEGLARRLEDGSGIEDIHSVASFFISRIDTEIDARLARLDDPSHLANLRGKAGIANALLAYQLFLDRFASKRWRDLSEAGAQLQRPLWASTGVKDPSLPASLYVESLITGDSVNTMPETTLNSVAALDPDHSIEPVRSGSPRFAQASEHIADLASLGVRIDEVGEQLEQEGLEKFITPWRTLHEKVEMKMRS